MITKEQALEALENMDDYARMADIHAIGPIGILKEYIKQTSTEAEHYRWLREQNNISSTSCQAFVCDMLGEWIGDDLDGFIKAVMNKESK